MAESYGPEGCETYDTLRKACRASLRNYDWRKAVQGNATYEITANSASQLLRIMQEVKKEGLLTIKNKRLNRCH